jgi:predicted ester cyclase
MGRIWRFGLVAIILGHFVTTATADEAANVALVRKFYQAINSRNLDALDAIVSSDFADHMADPQQPHGIDALKQSLAPFISSSSDLKFVNDPVIAKGDFVTVVDTISGTNDGEIMGMQPTNKSFEFSAIDIWRIKDGKLAEAWHVEQMLQMMMQIGAIGQK